MSFSQWLGQGREADVIYMSVGRHVVLICSEVMSMKQNIQTKGKFLIRRASLFSFLSPHSVLLQQKGGKGADKERIFQARPINQLPSISPYLPAVQ